METEDASVCCQLALFLARESQKDGLWINELQLYILDLDTDWQIWSLCVGHQQIFAVLGASCICWKGLEVPGDADTFTRRICLTFLIGPNWTNSLALDLAFCSCALVRFKREVASACHWSWDSVWKWSGPQKGFRSQFKGRSRKPVRKAIFCAKEKELSMISSKQSGTSTSLSHRPPSTADGIAWNWDGARLRE